MSYRRQSPQPVVEGGTGAQTLTSHGVLLGNTTSAITATAAGTTGQVLTGVTGSAPTFQSPAASSITITGDSGGGLSGSSFTFTGGTTGLTFAGSGSTETLGGTLAVKNGGTGAATLTGVLTGNGTSAVTANAVTQYGVVVGGASNAVASTAVGGTGTVLQGNTGAAPTYSTATYPSTTTINQLLYSSANNVVGGVTAGDYGVLISSSTGVPSWLANGTTGQLRLLPLLEPLHSPNAAASSITLTGDTGGGLSGSSFTIKTNRVNGGGTTVYISGSGSTLLLNIQDGAALNIMMGSTTGNTTYSGNSNTLIGAGIANGLTSGSHNDAHGTYALRVLLPELIIQYISGGSFTGITTGGYNTSLGSGNGGNYATGSESSNICIGYGVSGANNTSNALIIGNGTGTGNGNVSSATICGITGKTSSSGSEMYCNASNVIGTSTSAARFKKNITDMNEASEDIYKLRPVTFNYKVDGTHVNEEDSKLIQYGLIAEEVLEVMPQLVIYNLKGEVESLRYRCLVPMLLNEIQKLNKRVEELEKR